MMYLSGANRLNAHSSRPTTRVRRSVSNSEFVVLVGLFLLTPVPAAMSADVPGQAIWRQKCAGCHGPAGEGTAEHFPQQLTGDKSVAELTKLIAETMPEDEPISSTPIL